MVLKSGQSFSLLLGDIALLTHGLSVKSFGSRIPDTSTLLPGRLPAVLQFPTLSERDGSASLGTWHVMTLNRITVGSLGRRSDRPVVGGDLVTAFVGYHLAEGD